MRIVDVLCLSKLSAEFTVYMETSGASSAHKPEGIFEEILIFS